MTDPFMLGVRRWATQPDGGRLLGWIASHNLRPIETEVGHYLQARVAVGSEDWVGAGLYFSSGVVSLNSEGANAVVLYVDTTGRTKLVTLDEIGDGAPAAGSQVVPSIPANTFEPFAVGALSPNVRLWLRLGRVTPNVWRGETSTDGQTWSPVADDRAHELDPVYEGCCELEWPSIGAFAWAYVDEERVGSLS